MEQNIDLQNFETKVHESLYSYLRQLNLIDERMPDMPDIEGKWTSIAETYITDGVREFNDYPEVSLGWMMYVGMAVAQFWDEDWTSYADRDDIYLSLRDKQGFDYMDEHIRRDILKLQDDDFRATEKYVGECAQRTLSTLRRESIQPSTPEAFRAYVVCLHQLYIMGAAVQLYLLGYKMTKITNREAYGNN